MITPYWKKQMDHDLTRGYAETLAKIYKWFKPKSVLEIGTGWGISGSVAMDCDVHRLVTIDATSSPEYFAVAQTEILTHRKDNQEVEFLNLWSKDFLAKNEEKFDLIFIDGDHSYNGAKSDLYNSVKFLNDKGLVIMDDYLHKGNFIDGNECRVSQAARDFMLENSQYDYAIVPHNKENGFLVIKKRR